MRPLRFYFNEGKIAMGPAPGDIGRIKQDDKTLLWRNTKVRWLRNHTNVVLLPCHKKWPTMTKMVESQ